MSSDTDKESSVLVNFKQGSHIATNIYALATFVGVMNAVTVK